MWLDAQVKRFFAVSTESVTMPDIVGKPLAEARELLIRSKLVLGSVADVAASDPQVGMVIGQFPFPKTVVQANTRVECVVGQKP